MNKWTGMGRLTKDPELRDGENVVARFSVAINRRFKNAEGNYDTDFINCVAFGKTAEFIGKYFAKGDMIGIVGRIQTGNYTNKEGQKVYTTDIVVEETHFCGSKNESGNSGSAPVDNFQNIDPDISEELPFN